MQDLVIIHNGEPLTTSKIVADVFGKTHRDVIRAINGLECSDKFRARNFAQSSYTTLQNKTLQCISMTKDGFSFLCMGFTGKKAAKWKEAYIETFNSMERGLINADARINKLSIEGEEIKNAGKEWSSFGREINKMKKEHIRKVGELMDDVQLKLNLKG